MRFTALAAFCLLISAPVFAHHQQDQQQQQDDRDKAKKQQQDERQKQDQNRQQQDEKAQKDERKGQNEKAQEQQQNRQEKQQRDAAKQQEKQQKDMEKQQSQNERNRGGEHQTAAENGRTRHGGRMIPEDRFHASFGRGHRFRIGHRPDNREFAYGGYTFEYVEAWPAGWAYNDDFYVDYIDDDYYLCDLDHPGVRLVVIVIV